MRNGALDYLLGSESLPLEDGLIARYGKERRQVTLWTKRFISYRVVEGEVAPSRGIRERGREENRTVSAEGWASLEWVPYYHIRPATLRYSTLRLLSVKIPRDVSFFCSVITRARSRFSLASCMRKTLESECRVCPRDWIPNWMRVGGVRAYRSGTREHYRKVESSTPNRRGNGRIERASRNYWTILSECSSLWTQSCDIGADSLFVVDEELV